MAFGKTKKDEKGNTKGLIEIIKEQLVEVEAEMTALTDEYNNLWQQYIQYQENGETLKALEAHGQWKHKRENVLSDLKYKRQMLCEELGGVDSYGCRTGLVGEAKSLKFSLSSFDKQLKAYDAEIEELKRRFDERIETIKEDIKQIKVQKENDSQRLNELEGANQHG